VRVFLKAADMFNSVVQGILLYLDPEAPELILLDSNLALIDRSTNKTIAQFFGETIDDGLGGKLLH